jgi:hypothetical protein
MKLTAITLLALVALGTLAAVAFAAAPLPGNYQSTDIGGTIPPGRYTEGWAPGGGGLLTGAVHNAMSWDGTALGTAWKYTCGVQTAPAVLIMNTVNALGYGQKTYACTFVGGRVWLSGSGPWANGDPMYEGPIDSYVEYESIQYAAWQPVAAVTNVNAMAHWDNYPLDCMVFSVANGSRVGDTNLGGSPPANYPPFLATDCSPTMVNGAWWNMNSMTLSISSCVTGTKNSTWGAIKSIYR